MSSEAEIQSIRLEKLKRIKAAGLNPYPSTSGREMSLAELRVNFETLAKEEKTITVAGRIMSLRPQGALIFLTLFDGESFQVLLKSDSLTEDSWQLFNEVVDIGDFIDITGTLFTTKRGEPTLLACDWKILVKTLKPLPDKWHGLTDDETRYRKRYLDLLMDQEKRQTLILKAKFWAEVREFFKARNFLEVETPTLELSTGGAEANPFKTHHDDFDLDVYLRISVGELWQKRLLAGGFSQVYEIGRVYRNEGSSPEHLQEFTNAEFYAAFMSFEAGQEMIKELYRTLAQKVFGQTKFTVKDHTFDLAADWPEMDYVSTVREMTGLDILEASEEEMADKLEELGVVYQGKNRERMADSLWKYCRKKISGPAFLINHPKLVAPLSKEHPTDSRLTLTCQVILAGSEIGRAHAELNDPIDQAKRFAAQQELLAAGDDEAMMPDDDFVEMLEYGMPPAFGFGFGERLFSYLAGLSIRETQAFPLIKPKN